MGFELQRRAALQEPVKPSHDSGKQAATNVQMRALAASGFDAASAALAPVQMDGGKSAMDPATVQGLAQAGMKGAGGAMPHLQAIQASFGKHDVSGVAAHAGGSAGAACDEMGASAYASGNAVAFKGQPDLHTAAHEAAHVVQQRGGVSLEGGVGRTGDSHERHADTVADMVVQGKSAEGLLDRYGGAKAPDAGVQQKAVQRKSGFFNALKRGKKATKEMQPVYGALWDKSATKSMDSDNPLTKTQKRKVWASRAGQLLGTLIAPTFTLVTSFVAQTIVSNRKHKKDKRKKEQAQKKGRDPKEILKDQIGTLCNEGGFKSACKQADLSYVAVWKALNHRLGLSADPPYMDEHDSEVYTAFEDQLRKQHPLIAQAFEEQGIPTNASLKEEDEVEVEDEEKILGGDAPTKVDDNKGGGNTN